MDEQKNLRVLFTTKADLIFSELITKYNLQESDDALRQKIKQKKETHTKILRDAIKTLAKKMIPQEKLAELLAEHLEISQENAKKLVEDINVKLLPLLLMYPDEKFDDENFREEIAKKIGEGEEWEAKQQTEANIENPEYQKEKLREDLLNRLRKNFPQQKPEKPTTPNLKGVPIANVEKNAENMKKEGKNITTTKKEPVLIEQQEKLQSSPVDKYKEPIE